jgi:hypothetical protein
VIARPTARTKEKASALKSTGPRQHNAALGLTLNGRERRAEIQPAEFRLHARDIVLQDCGEVGSSVLFAFY